VTAFLASPAARRRTAIASALALVAALLTFGAPLGASADVVGDGPGTVSGTVTLSDGSPLAGAFVNVSKPAGEGSAWGFSTNTDANGAYEFTGLPADTIYVQVYTPGYQPAAGQTVTLTESAPTASVNFSVAPFEVGIGSISGHVTTDGVAAANISVSIFNASTFQGFNTITDESGAFAFSDLSNGSWQVSSYAGPDYQYIDPQFAQLTDLAPAATVDLAFISWETGTAAIAGVLTDSETGLAVAGASINVYGIDVAYQSNIMTDETGAFSAELLPEGSYSLFYWAFGYLTFSEELQAISDQTATVSHALVPTNAAISGHVKAKDGTPLAGVYVSAHTSNSNIGDGITDENGDYVIDGLGAVEYTLTVGGVGTPYKLKEKTVTAVANGSATANFTLKDRTRGTIGGMALAQNGEYYTAPVCVSLYTATKKNPIAEVVTLGVDFGDGTYTFDDVKPGTYTVQFEDCDDDPARLFDTAFLGGAKTKAEATFITIAAAEDSWGNDFVFEPRSTTSIISGHVEKSNGTPLAGLVVQATDGIASSASAVTDANGNYTITGLFTDEYTVTVSGVATPYAQKSKTVTTIEDGSVTANFSLKKR